MVRGTDTKYKVNPSYPYISMHILLNADKENLFDNQELL